MARSPTRSTATTWATPTCSCSVTNPRSWTSSCRKASDGCPRRRVRGPRLVGSGGGRTPQRRKRDVREVGDDAVDPRLGQPADALGVVARPRVDRQLLIVGPLDEGTGDQGVVRVERTVALVDRAGDDR